MFLRFFLLFIHDFTVAPTTVSCVSPLVFLPFLAFNIAASRRLPAERLFVSTLSRVFVCVCVRGTAAHDRGNEFLSTAATRNSLRINF